MQGSASGESGGTLTLRRAVEKSLQPEFGEEAVPKKCLMGSKEGRVTQKVGVSPCQSPTFFHLESGPSHTPM